MQYRILLVNLTEAHVIICRRMEIYLLWPSRSAWGISTQGLLFLCLQFPI